MLAGSSMVLNVFLWIIIVLAGFLFYAFGLQRVVKHYVHYPIPAFAVRFIDNPIRRLFQPPRDVVNWIEISEGMSVLEIGPGPGTFTFEVAKRIGDKGSLFAVDIQPSVVSRLCSRLRAKEITNVTPVVASAHALPFSDNSFNRIFMVAVLGEIPDKNKTLLEVKRVLKNEGLLAIGELLPDPDYPRQKSVIGWCDDAGLKLVATHGGLIHYMLTFKK